MREGGKGRRDEEQKLGQRTRNEREMNERTL